MRVLKFRAWDNDAGCMCESWDSKWHFGVSSEGKLLSRDERGAWAYEREADWILMQYTGIKDKDGTEIYEGDIIVGNSLLSWSGDWMMTVSWDDHLCGFEIHRSPDDGNDLVVVGNIYENPTLVTDSEDMELLSQFFSKNPELLEE